MGQITSVVVVISADIEWKVVKELFPQAIIQESPLGEYFVISISSLAHSVIYFHGGWGKIAAAASAQYIIDRWQPELLINLGTCGGFSGEVEKGEILLVERTIVYDIIEQMGDYDEHITHYTTEIDLTWLKDEYPHPVRRTLIVSGDRDLLVEDIPHLKSAFGAIAGDWESGSIAWVTARNNTRCLILRGVTDLVEAEGSPAYGNLDYFLEGTRGIMRRLVNMLPGWLEMI